MTTRVRLTERWSLWDDVCVRGTGFPIDFADGLASPALAAAADRLLAAEEQLREARNVLARLLDARRRAADPEGKRPLRRLALRIWKDVPAQYEGDDAEIRAGVSQLADLHGAFTQARNALAALWPDTHAALDRHLRALAGDARLREAMLWQNPDAFARVDALLASGERAFDKPQRRAHLLLARYLARYTCKNESIGFFGPVCWGRIDDRVEAIHVAPGEALIGQSRVRFEYWVLDALARRLFAAPESRLDIPPRLSPMLALEGERVLDLRGREVTADPAVVGWLRLSDGRTSAREICDRFARSGVSAHDVLATLESLRSQHLLVWSAALPSGPDASSALSALVLGVPDPPRKHAMQASFARLDGARRDAEAAVGDLAAVETALARVDAVVREETGTSARRNEGVLYAGRTPLYLDCRRDLDLRLGSDLVRAIATPLGLVLDSARWYAQTLASQLMDLVEGTHATLAESSRDRPVSLGALWASVQGTELVPAVVEDVASQLHERWAALIACEPGARRVERDPQALAREDAFACERGDWPAARIQSPDLMIAARDLQAIGRGEWCAVLGELHMAIPTALQRSLFDSHPDPKTLGNALACDRPEPELTPVFPHWGAGHRATFDFATPHDLHVEQDETPSWRERDRAIAIAALMVEREGDRLCLRTRDGARRFRLLPFLMHLLRPWFRDTFSLFAPSNYAPRVTFGRLVVTRERWRLPMAELAGLRPGGAAERFVTARRIARRLGWPRRLFYRIGSERKPLLLDLDAPVSVDDLAHHVRGNDPGAWASFSEMLPGHDQCWLPDAQARRYACELRLTAVANEPASL